MNIGSLFAGIGGFDLGFERAGFSLAWHAEIDKAASAILRYRWPDVPNLGDVTKIDGAAIGPVDVICGGFPCQDLSVAGKRAGFTGKRSVLAFEFLRIVAEMREATNGSAPTFVVLENVPGLFSSSGGRDFGALLDAMGELGALDIAWRVLDSRYFGVAQRRRRVFVVVDFGGERAEEILALREGLRGDPPSSRAAREDVAHALRGRANPSHREDSDSYIPLLSPALKARDGKGPSSDGDGDGAPLIPFVAHTLRADGFDASEDGTGRGVPLVADPISAHEQSTYTHEGSGNFRLRNVIPFDTTQLTSAANYSRPQPGDPSHPLAAGAHAPAVAFTVSAQANGFAWESPVAPTLGAHPQSDTSQRQTGIRTPSGVRRLTPRECERLQGFPDDWTAIPGMADGPRYKCLGNAVTVNVAEWIACRVEAALAPAKGGERG